MAGRGGPRTRVIDHVAPGADQDPEFLRVKRELEDTQQRQGWLFGRGAFDRQDIMYLKEHKEETITKEQELDDMALSEFARLRSQASAEFESSLPQPGAGTVMLAVKQKNEMKPVSKLLPIKIASSSSLTRQASGTQPAMLSPGAASPDAGTQAKRPGPPLDEDSKPNKLAKQSTQSAEDSGGLAGLLGYADSDEDEGEHNH